MDPINYLGMVPQVDLGRQFLTGLQAGAGLGEIQDQAAARQLALQQKQVAMERAAQYQSDVGTFMQNPTPQGAAALQLKYPDQYEPISKAWAGLSADQQKNELQDTYTIASTLHAGRPDLALQQIDDRIQAHKNSGMPTADLEALRAQVESDPKGAYGQVLHIVSALPGGDKILSNLTSIGQEQRATDEASQKSATAASDLYLKNLSIIGQKAGALAKPGVKPEQVQTMFRSLAAQGVIPKDELQGYLDSVPSDPKDLPDYLGTFRDAGLTPDQQMKYTTPDANTVANNDRIAKEGAANRANALAVQDRIDARNKDKGDTEPTLDADTLTNMAQQYLAGDKSVMQNLGRGAQGAANIVALRQAITREAKAQGLTGPQIAAKMAEFAGTMAGQRTAGTRIANVEMAANEAANLVPLAQQASAEVVRSGFLPFGKAQLMFDNQTNDPAMRKFVAANNSLVNAYSRAISPSGTPSVSDKEHAREMLATAFDHNSYIAVTNQMLREIEAARAAPKAVRQAFSAEVSGQGHTATPAPATHPADINALLSKYGKK